MNKAILIRLIKIQIKAVDARIYAANHGSGSRSTMGEFCSALSLIYMSEKETLEAELKKLESEPM